MTERAVRARAGVALPDGSPGSAVRRAPFADNPALGLRGQQAQQRVLDAALQVFGEVGYHPCRVQRITELAGCSRVSFYQYFSSKEDCFRHLAGRVARRLSELVDSLPAITEGAEGHEALVSYLDQYTVLYSEYQPIFVAFQTAASSDRGMAEGAQRVGARVLARLEAKIVGASEADELEGTVRTIVESAVRANRLHELIEAGTPPVRLTRQRVNLALADVGHRALFGVIDGVNLRTPVRRAQAFPVEDMGGSGVGTALCGGEDSALGASGRHTRAAILAAGRQVYVERGYYGTRVDDIVRAAGVSHGVFYRYFENKDELFRLLATRSSARFIEAHAQLGGIDLHAADALGRFRAWLDHYAETGAEAAAIVRVWADAITRDPLLGNDSAAAVRAACRGIIDLLVQRGSGDVDAEAVVMLVLLEAMTAGRSSPPVERVGRVIETALLFR